MNTSPALPTAEPHYSTPLSPAAQEMSTELRAKFNRLFASIQKSNRTCDPAKIAFVLLSQEADLFVPGLD